MNGSNGIEKVSFNTYMKKNSNIKQIKKINTTPKLQGYLNLEEYKNFQVAIVKTSTSIL